MKKICQFYLNGNCKFGDKCKNLHQGNPQQNNHQSKGCTFFLTDSCNRPNCQYFHGYCEILEHVKKIENHKEPINNLINMDDTKFISSDEKTFYIRFSGNDDFHEETIAQGYKIGKLVYYSDKVICAIQKEGMIEEKNYIVIYNNEGYCMCETKNKPNDIFENSNTIITVEKDVIEVFEFSQIKDNNDKIINNLVKKSEINLDNNNNNNNNFNNINSINNNNNNNNIDNEILCIEYSQPGFFVCGHTSGLMSLWKPDPQVYLQKVQAQKLHDRAINKILYTKLSNDKSYLISCSSDKTVKVYDIEGNNVVKVQPFEDEVMDVKLVNDFNKNRVFIISLKNGKLFAMNEGFNPLFEIPSRFKTTITRHVIPLKNPLESETRGDLLAITELGKIDVFAWVKEGSINLNPHKNNNNPHNGFHNAPYNGPHNGPHNTPYNGPHNAPHNGPFNNNHPHFPYFSNPMFGPRGRYN